MKVPEKLSDFMAERQLTASGSGKNFSVRILIGRPEKSPDADDYCCLLQIQGLGDGRVKHIVGLDAIQALQLTLGYIRDTLDHLANLEGVGLEWAENPGSGF